ncbi:MAG: ATP-binding protein [Clostridia bacterium]|nr:ATP-binding protein [Clostridia bacterium]
MFIGREKVLKELTEQLESKKKTAVLVYGKRRVGKTTLIAEAAKSFSGVVIEQLFTNSTLPGNIALFGATVCEALDLPPVRFQTLNDIFEFLKSQKRDILVVMDEYQYLKQSGKKNEVDSFLQDIVDHLTPQVKVVLCGSYITIMKELLERENPLFGRFTHIVHLEEFDYYDAARFYPEASVRRKIANYAIFGGSPFVLENLEESRSLKENVVNLLLPETGLLRSYMENIILREIQKVYDIRIFEALGNGKKRYSEIQSLLGGDGNGLLDKQLKTLIQMESISKVAPINKQNDKKKQFYEITDNLMRFYFTFIFNRTGQISRLGEEAYYDAYIEPLLNQFISRRFEDQVRQYFGRVIRAGKRKDILDYGTLWYDDPKTRTNGEFDCVLETKSGYEFYECKFYRDPMGVRECEEEEVQMRNVPGVEPVKVGFVCSAGFAFSGSSYILIPGEELYDASL